MSHDHRLIVWRDSVCAGDDCDAPHECAIRMASDATLLQLAGRLIDLRCLANISGGRATWILEAISPLAVFAQQWALPRFLVPPDTPLAPLVAAESRPHLNFKYWCQVDPDEVFACLRSGTALPDKYGRAT